MCAVAPLCAADIKVEYRLVSSMRRPQPPLPVSPDRQGRFSLCAQFDCALSSGIIVGLVPRLSGWRQWLPLTLTSRGRDEWLDPGWWRQPDEGLVSPISRAEMSRVSIIRKSVDFVSSLSAARLKRRAALSFYCSMAKVTVTLIL